MKTCSRCKQAKPFESFYASKTKDGLTYWCRGCYADHYRENKERQLLSNQRARVRRRYGLTLETYNEVIAQGCAVCGSTDNVFLDHDHGSGSIRAPLCRGCNLALGAVHDDPARLEALARFLRDGEFISPPLVAKESSRYRGPCAETLSELYIDEGLSIAAIAARYDVSPAVIQKRLKELSIPRRPRWLMSPAARLAAQ